MNATDEILGIRLRGQLIERPADGERTAELSPENVVAHLCAMQAQDYPGALWAVALRSAPGTTAADVERALAERRIVRTWPMRGTLHFLGPNDVRWMLALLTPRVIARSAGRYSQLELTDEDFTRARTLLEEALSGGHAFTRAQMMSTLEAGGISTAGQRGYHILGNLAQTAVICLGPVSGKQQTFVLLDEWIPPAGDAPLGREEALTRLAPRYFGARGPATLADFAWWAGITKAEARIGIDGAGDALIRTAVNDAVYWTANGPGVGPVRASKEPAVHLLPAFDEYLLGYTDRSAQLGGHRPKYSSTVSANGMFSPTLVIDGRVTGTWKRALKRDRVEFGVYPFRQLSDTESRALAVEAERYGTFVGLRAETPVVR